MWDQVLSGEFYVTRRALLAALAPAPIPEVIGIEVRRDVAVNPHNESHRPPRRSPAEIEFELRLRWADGLLAAAQLTRGDV